MKIVAVIQARLASTRLPGKVLMDLCGSPMLDHVIRRVQAVRQIDTIFLSGPPEDQAALWRPHLGLHWAPHRPPDVLSAFLWAAAPIIVRVTADCPFFAPELADEMLTEFLKQNVDYLGTTRPILAYPDGLDIEIIRREAIHAAHQEATGDDREHVASFIWRQPDRFTIGRLTPLSDPWALGLKLSVDTQEDLDRARRIMAKIPSGDFSMAATLHAAQEVNRETSDHDL